MNRIREIIRTDVAKNSAKLISANIIAQAIGLLVYPILTRLYAPEDFGLFNLFLSIGSILVILATAEYQYAIMLPKRDKDAMAVFQTGVFLVLLLTVVLCLTLPFRRGIAALFKTPELADWYFLLPWFVLGTALWNLLNYWLVRKKHFTNISVYQLSQSIINSGSKYGLGVAGCLGGGLIISSVVGCVAALGISVAAVVRRYARQFVHIRVARCRAVAKRYANFPKYSLPRAFVNQFSGNLPFLLLTPFFTMAEMGFLGMAFTLSFRPINVVVNALYQVFFQKTSEQVKNRQSIRNFFYKFIVTALCVLLPCFAGLYFVLPWLTEWLLGDNWSTTGEYLQLMLPWLLVIAIGSSIAYIPDVFQQQKISMFIEIAYFVLRLCVLCIGIVFHSFRLTILLYSLLGALIISGQIVWYLHLVSRYEKSIRQA